jgi:hypothetical protein
VGERRLPSEFAAALLAAVHADALDLDFQQDDETHLDALDSLFGDDDLLADLARR